MPITFNFDVDPRLMGNYAFEAYSDAQKHDDLLRSMQMQQQATQTSIHAGLQQQQMNLQYAQANQRAYDNVLNRGLGLQRAALDYRAQIANINRQQWHDYYGRVDDFETTMAKGMKEGWLKPLSGDQLNEIAKIDQDEQALSNNPNLDEGQKIQALNQLHDRRISVAMPRRAHAWEIPDDPLKALEQNMVWANMDDGRIIKATPGVKPEGDGWILGHHAIETRNGAQHSEFKPLQSASMMGQEFDQRKAKKLEVSTKLANDVKPYLEMVKAAEKYKRPDTLKPGVSDPNAPETDHVVVWQYSRYGNGPDRVGKYNLQTPGGRAAMRHDAWEYANQSTDNGVQNGVLPAQSGVAVLDLNDDKSFEMVPAGWMVIDAATGRQALKE